MTQHELILSFLKTNKAIVPAKMGGHIYLGEMFGSETSKRCRELRKKGILESHQEGRFEVFTLKERQFKEMKVLDSEGRVEKIIKILV